MNYPIAIAILAVVPSIPSTVPNETRYRTPTLIVQADKTGNFKFEKSQGAHTAVVIFHTRAFQRSKHRVARDSRQQTRVDGRPAIGTDGNIPSIEIDSMKLVLDGKEIAVPKSLFADCFEPHFDGGDLTVKFGPRLASVIVSMSGSDGAGGYEVIWRLRGNGQHSRSIKQGF